MRLLFKHWVHVISYAGYTVVPMAVLAVYSSNQWSPSQCRLVCSMVYMEIFCCKKIVMNHENLYTIQKVNTFLHDAT